MVESLIRKGGGRGLLGSLDCKLDISGLTRNTVGTRTFESLIELYSNRRRPRCLRGQETGRDHKAVVASTPSLSLIESTSFILSARGANDDPSSDRLALFTARHHHGRRPGAAHGWRSV